MPKKKILISGNCITEAIPAFLETNKEFNKKYEIKPLKPVFMVKEEDVEGFHKQMKQCDIFLTQPIVGENYKKLGIDTETLKTFMKKDSKTIIIPVPYFTGYFPEQFYLHDELGNMVGQCEGLPSPYNNKIILWGYVNKHSAEDIYNLLYKDKCMKNIKQNVTDCIDELKRREQEQDFKISDFIEKNYRTNRLFWTLNHPTNTLLKYMSEEIIKQLGIKRKFYQILGNIKTIKKEFLGNHNTPILPSVEKELNLKIKGEKTHYTVEYIKSVYKYYDKYQNLVELNKKYTEDLF